MHLVLARVGEPDARMPERRLGLRPADQVVAEVEHRARRLVAVADRVGDRMRLEQLGGLARIALELGAADVDQGMGAGRLVAQPGGERQRAPTPLDRLVAVLGQHRELRDAAVGTGQLGRLARRSRIATAARAVRRASSPSPAYQWKRERIRVQRPTASWSPSSRCSPMPRSIAANAASGRLTL